VNYQTTKYGCVDVYVRVKGSEIPQGAGGACGGTDEVVEDLSNTVWGLGRVANDAGSPVYRSAWGRVGSAVTQVRATLSNGKTVADKPSGTFWILVIPEDVSFVRVDALDESGRVVATVTPP